MPVRHEERFAEGVKQRNFLAVKKEPIKRDSLSFSGHHGDADKTLRTATALFPFCRS